MTLDYTPWREDARRWSDGAPVSRRGTGLGCAIAERAPGGRIRPQPAAGARTLITFGTLKPTYYRAKRFFPRF